MSDHDGLKGEALETYKQLGMNKDMQVLDYRPEMLTEILRRCPECGAEVAVSERQGQANVTEGDLKSWAAPFDVVAGPARTLWLAWRCRADAAHYSGPKLYG